MTQKRKAKTLSNKEFFNLFPNEKAARKYVEKIIWGRSAICPKCRGKRNTPRPKHKGYRCRKCRIDFSVKKGTLFEGSNIPLDIWLDGIRKLMTARMGVSSLELSKELGIQQKSAWFMLHRLREALAPPEYGNSRGMVQTDVSRFGGLQRNMHADRRSAHSRGGRFMMAAVGMWSPQGGTRLRPIIAEDRAEMREFLLDHALGASTVCTDGHGSFAGLDRIYDHYVSNHAAGEYSARDHPLANTNGIESVWASGKRSYKGVYIQWSEKHFAKYLNEVAFRLDIGNCEVDMIDRIAVVVARMAGKRMTYERLTNPVPFSDPDHIPAFTDWEGLDAATTEEERRAVYDRNYLLLMRRRNARQRRNWE